MRVIYLKSLVANAPIISTFFAQVPAICSGATVANLVATGTATGIIKWYNASIGGTALTPTTTLNSGTYYTSQTVGVCESTRTQVAVTVNQIVTPTFTQVSAICSGGTLAVLPTTSNNANNAITGTWSPALSNTTTTTYTFTPTIGQCATTTTMTITVNPIPQTPSALAQQAFCNGATVATLVATGTGIKWYSALTGGTALASTAVVSAGNYYATQTVSGCESPRTVVAVSITTAAQPTVISPQNFCTGATVSNLAATGANVAWYADAVSNTALLPTTALLGGMYYVNQTENGCLSTRKPVAVNVTTLVAANDDFYYVKFVNDPTSWQTPSVLDNDIYDYPPTITLGTSTPPLDGITSTAGLITFPSTAVAGTTYEIPYTFTQFGCTSTPAYVRVRVSDPAVRADGAVWVVDTQENATDSERKIIISGEFSHYNKVYCNRIARLNNDLTLDPTFKLPYWFNLDILDMKVQSDNKILIAGVSFAQDSPNAQHGIMRLNADGSIDPTLNSGPLASGTTFRGAQGDGTIGSIAQVTKIFVLPAEAGEYAGHILVAGSFYKYNGYRVGSYILLKPNGDYDPTLPFNVNVNTLNEIPISPDTTDSYGLISPPYTFAFQRGILTGPSADDWQIIVGGQYLKCPGVFRHILRLSANGILDTAFNVSPGYVADNNGFVNKIIIEPGATPDADKIIMAGQFSHFYAGGINYSRKNLARLDANGALDISFNVGNGFSDAVADNGFTFGGYHATVKDMFLDTSGTEHLLYACGRFTSYNNVGCDEIIRIKCNSGIKDPSFQLLYNGPNGSDIGPVYSMKQQYGTTTGLYSNILLGGNFTTYADDSGATHAKYITRISNTSNSIENKSANTYLDNEPEISDLNNNELILYPNPSSGKINFITSVFNKNPFNVFVYNTLGQKVFERTNLTAKESELNLTDLHTGTYFITFSNGEKTITKAIILK